jgi:hypothetical protein
MPWTRVNRAVFPHNLHDSGAVFAQPEVLHSGVQRGNGQVCLYFNVEDPSLVEIAEGDKTSRIRALREHGNLNRKRLLSQIF